MFKKNKKAIIFPSTLLILSFHSLTVQIKPYFHKGFLFWTPSSIAHHLTAIDLPPCSSRRHHFRWSSRCHHFPWSSRDSPSLSSRISSPSSSPRRQFSSSPRRHRFTFIVAQSSTCLCSLVCSTFRFIFHFSFNELLFV